jgi:hypothetical protein
MTVHERITRDKYGIPSLSAGLQPFWNLVAGRVSSGVIVGCVQTPTKGEPGADDLPRP